MRSKSWKPVAMPMGLPRFLIRLLDAVGGFADGGGAVLQAGLFRVEAEVEKAFLAGVEDLVGRALEVAGFKHQLDADAVDLAAAPVVAELVGPMTDGGGGAFDAGVFGGDEAGAAFDLVELAGLAESFGKGEQVDGLTLGAEGLEDLPGGRVDGGEEPVVVHELHGGVEGGGAAVKDAADQAGFGGLAPEGDGVGVGVHKWVLRAWRWSLRRRRRLTRARPRKLVAVVPRRRSAGLAKVTPG
jgi:hypothetical protein